MTATERADSRNDHSRPDSQAAAVAAVGLQYDLMTSADQRLDGERSLEGGGGKVTRFTPIPTSSDRFDSSLRKHHFDSDCLDATRPGGADHFGDLENKRSDLDLRNDRGLDCRFEGITERYAVPSGQSDPSHLESSTRADSRFTDHTASMAEHRMMTDHHNDPAVAATGRLDGARVFDTGSLNDTSRLNSARVFDTGINADRLAAAQNDTSTRLDRYSDAAAGLTTQNEPGHLDSARVDRFDARLNVAAQNDSGRLVDRFETGITDRLATQSN